MVINEEDESADVQDSQPIESEALNNNNQNYKSVFDRMQDDIASMPTKKELTKNKIEAERQVDKYTGQPLFKPQTGKAPSHRQNQIQKQGGIANYLYMHAQY